MDLGQLLFTLAIDHMGSVISDAVLIHGPVALWCEDGSVDVPEVVSLAKSYFTCAAPSVAVPLSRIGVPAKMAPEDMCAMRQVVLREVVAAKEREERRGNAEYYSTATCIAQILKGALADGIRTARELRDQVVQYQDMARVFTVDDAPLHDLIAAGVPSWMHDSIPLY